MLRKTGAQVWRVGFNAGDAAFWDRAPGYIPYQGTVDDWPETLASLLRGRRTTDIVHCGDTRPLHAEAVGQAKAAGLRVHVFEKAICVPTGSRTNATAATGIRS